MTKKSSWKKVSGMYFHYFSTRNPFFVLKSFIRYWKCPKINNLKFFPAITENLFQNQQKISQTSVLQIQNLKDFLYNKYYEQKLPK